MIDTISNFGMPNWKRIDEREPWRLRHLLEAHLAEIPGDRAADDDAEQHGNVAEEALEEARDQQDRHQHQGGHAEVERVAVGGRRRHSGAGGPVDADAHQRDADHEDDGAGHHRREQRQQVADDRRDQYRKDAGRDHGAEDAEDAEVGVVGHRHHGPDRGERDAHHHRQLDAEQRPEPVRLDQRGDAAGKQVGVDQQRDLLGRQLEGAADDQRHGHSAGIHDQHVLDTERNQPVRRQHLVDRMHRMITVRCRRRGGRCRGYGDHDCAPHDCHAQAARVTPSPRDPIPPSG